jgi:hypothetical protein
MAVVLGSQYRRKRRGHQTETNGCQTSLKQAGKNKAKQKKNKK